VANPAKLTRLQRNQIQLYMNEILTRLNMGEWALRVRPELCEAGTDDSIIYAEINALEEYRDATLRVSSKFLGLSPREQRATLVHESMHLITARLRRCKDAVEELMAPGVFAQWEDGFDKAEEYAVEMTSRLLSGLLPLPRFG
jgi:hypothetical protein